MLSGVYAGVIVPADAKIYTSALRQFFSPQNAEISATSQPGETGTSTRTKPATALCPGRRDEMIGAVGHFMPLFLGKGWGLRHTHDTDFCRGFTKS